MHRDKQGKIRLPNFLVSLLLLPSLIGPFLLLLLLGLLKMQLALSAVWSLANERIKSRYKGVSIDIYCPDYTFVKFARNSSVKHFLAFARREKYYIVNFCCLIYFISFSTVFMEYIYIIIRNAFYFYFERSHLEMIFDIESSVDPYFNIWISISKYSSTWDKIKNLLFSKLMESFDIYIYYRKWYKMRD